MNFKTFPVSILLLLFYLAGNCSTPLNRAASDSMKQSGVRISVRRDSLFSFRSERGFFPSLIHNFGEQAVAPFHMNSKQALMVTGGVVITGLLFIADHNIDNLFKPLKKKNAWIKESSPEITQLGGNYTLIFTGVYAGYSVITGDRKGFQTTLLSLQAMMTSGVWVRLGKMLTCRERPMATYDEKNTPNDKWWGPFQQFNSSVTINRGLAYFDAFPSGHTATAFSVASVFAHQYADKPFVAPFAYTVASLVGITRLIEHDHWASDVFAGACIGYLCGKQVVSYAKKLEASSHALNKKITSNYFFSLSGDHLMANYSVMF